MAGTASWGCAPSIHPIGGTARSYPPSRRSSRSASTAPGGCPAGGPLPPMVALALGAAAPPAEPARWFLTRPGGTPIDPSKTLQDNAVGEGDLILLTAAPPPAPRVVLGDPAGVVTATVRSP